MTNPGWSLQAFLDALEHRLENMSAQEIRESLLEHAQHIPSSERAAFYDIFDPHHIVYHGVEQDTAPDRTWPVDEHPLLHKIDEFVERIASGQYFAGFGWDDERDEERSFGDESWVMEFDGFLAETHDAFLSGHLGLARAAYQRLLDAFLLDDDVGTFCGPEPAIEMVNHDLAEVQARYLRAVYETTPVNERAEVFATTWSDLPAVDTEVSLGSVRESRRHDLPQIEQFLPAWIDELRSVGTHHPKARILLTEATELSAGLDGL